MFDYVNSDVVDLINDLKWQTLDQRRDHYSVTLLYKCVHGLAPLRLCDEIELVCNRHDINTHNSHYLNVDALKAKVECFKNSFKYSNAKVWNEIPSHIQCTTYRLTWCD